MDLQTNQDVIRKALLDYLNKNPMSLRGLSQTIPCAAMTLKLFLRGKDMRFSKPLLKVIRFLEMSRENK